MSKGRVRDILKGKNFLKLSEYTREEIEYLLDLSLQVKDEKYKGIYKKRLANKNIALIFEKDSTRTRCSFEVAASDEGANITYIGSEGSQFGKKESVEDTAKVLGRFYDGIEFRGYKQDDVEILGRHSGVPVWNGLTDQWHPTQILADLLTLRENFGRVEGLKVAYVGDGRNNVANSLLVGATKLGVEVNIVSPKELQPEKYVLESVEGKYLITDSIDEGVTGVDAVYTDVWVSMGEKNWEERIELLKPFQVDDKLMEKTAKGAIFMHCLPAFHDINTQVALDINERFGIDELEVTDSVFRGKASKVFDQAENRMHTIKAIMIATMGG